MSQTNFPFWLQHSTNHRITEWSGLEVTLKVTWFQRPCHEQGHLPLDQVHHLQERKERWPFGNLLHLKHQKTGQ